MTKPQNRDANHLKKQQHFGSQKTGHVDMLTPICNSLVNQHFFQSRTSRALSQSWAKQTGLRIKPRVEPRWAESGPEARINEPSGAELNRTSSQPELTRAERQVNQASHILFDYFNTLFVFCFIKKNVLLLSFISSARSRIWKLLWMECKHCGCKNKHWGCTCNLKIISTYKVSPQAQLGAKRQGVVSPPFHRHVVGIWGTH